MDASVETRRMRLEDLRAAPYNPRRISDHALSGLSSSITRFGLVQPVIWNRRTGYVVGGHQRVKVLEAEGVESRDVIVVDLPEAEEKALNVALNSPAISGEFMEDLDALLAEIAAELPEAYEDLQLKELILGTMEGRTSPDAPVVVPKEAVSEEGVLYELGSHRILCADSRRLESYRLLLGAERPALFATDPPYLVDYTGAERPVRPLRDPEGEHKRAGKDWTAVYNEVEVKDAGAFFRDVFAAAVEVCVENAAWYLWHAHKWAGLIVSVWEELGVLLHQEIVWVKPLATHGFSFWPWRHEPRLMGWRKGFRPDHDGDNSHTTFWEVDWEGKRRVVGNEHPTQKPVELFARPIRKHTQPGDVVLEPFAGSGSQIIAAEQTGRRCYAIELGPVFVDCCRKRWAEFVHGEGCPWESLTPAVGGAG
jgi:DNA modification methylase